MSLINIELSILYSKTFLIAIAHYIYPFIYSIFYGIGSKPHFPFFRHVWISCIQISSMNTHSISTTTILLTNDSLFLTTKSLIDIFQIEGIPVLLSEFSQLAIFSWYALGWNRTDLLNSIKGQLQALIFQDWMIQLLHH